MFMPQTMTSIQALLECISFQSCQVLKTTLTHHNITLQIQMSNNVTNRILFYASKTHVCVSLGPTADIMHTDVVFNLQIPRLFQT